MQFLRYLILIIFVLFSHNVKAETKIVFIDIDYLMKNSNIGKISLKKLDNLNNKNINALKENEKKLKQEENLLLQKRDIISQEEFEKELEILRTKIKEFNIYIGTVSSDITKEVLVEINNEFKE